MLPISGGITFKSGNKTRNSPLQNITPPEFVYLRAQDADSICISVGDSVSIGQPLVRSQDKETLPLYATVSGVIDSISDKDIVIKNNFENTVFSELTKVTVPLTDIKERDIENKVREMNIYDNGILLAEKLKLSIGKVEYVIINCTDCEPPIGINHRILHEKLDELIGGIKILIHAVRGRTGIIVLDSTQQNVIENLKNKINDPELIIFRTVENRYPMANDKVLLFALMRKEYQDKDIIKQSKSLILKPETAINVYECFTTGIPAVKKLLTVSGGVNESKNISVPIGTKISHVLFHCGGITKNEPQLVIGGIMTGKESAFDQIISHNTNSITVLENKLQNQKKCIRCGRCINVCPMLLKPIFLYSNIINGKSDKNQRLGINHCILCGCCSFVCPAEIPIAQTIKEVSTNNTNEDEKAKEEESNQV